MKKFLLLLPLLFCSACLFHPVRNTDIPNATGGPIPTRVGVSTSTTWFWLWNTGDASIDTAQQNGGITNISSITQATNNYLGFIKRHTTTVRGE
jgi:hypothetical protein